MLVLILIKKKLYLILHDRKLPYTNLIIIRLSDLQSSENAKTNDLLIKNKWLKRAPIIISILLIILLLSN